MKTRKEIKSKSIKDLNGNIFGQNWLLGLVMFVLFDVIVSLFGTIGSFLTNKTAVAIFCLLGFIEYLILCGPMTYGVIKELGKVSRNEEERYKIGGIFDGFRDCFGGSVILNLLKTVLLILWTLLLVVPGLIKSYSYRMSFYIYKDNPELDANTAITKSREMMDGYKWKLFVFDLSFLGWFIVGLLCLGIGLLWVVPYHQAATYNFYEALKEHQADLEK